MNRQLINRTFNLDLPGNYIMDDSNETINIYNDISGKGAITITIYTIPGNIKFDLGSELKDFAKSIDKNLNTDELPIKISGMASTNFIMNNTYWKLWIFFKNANAVFATYNCNIDDEEMEIHEINSIMNTLEFF
jgi:hypothetical protein